MVFEKSCIICKSICTSNPIRLAPQDWNFENENHKLYILLGFDLHFCFLVNKDKIIRILTIKYDMV